MPRLEVWAELALVVRSGGFLDGFIEDFHRLFRVTQSRRNLYPRDQLHVATIAADVQTDQLTNHDRGLGLANPVVGAKWQLAGDDGRAPMLAVEAALQLPWGSTGGQFATPRVGGLAALSLAQPLGPMFHLDAAFGLVLVPGTYAVYGMVLSEVQKFLLVTLQVRLGSQGGAGPRPTSTRTAGWSGPPSRRSTRRRTNSWWGCAGWRLRRTTWEMGVDRKHRARRQHSGFWALFLGASPNLLDAPCIGAPGAHATGVAAVPGPKRPADTYATHFLLGRPRLAPMKSRCYACALPLKKRCSMMQNLMTAAASRGKKNRSDDLCFAHVSDPKREAARLTQTGRLAAAADTSRAAPQACQGTQRRWSALPPVAAAIEAQTWHNRRLVMQANADALDLQAHCAQRSRLTQALCAASPAAPPAMCAARHAANSPRIGAAPIRPRTRRLGRDPWLLPTRCAPKRRRRTRKPSPSLSRRRRFGPVRPRHKVLTPAQRSRALDLAQQYATRATAHRVDLAEIRRDAVVAMLDAQPTFDPQTATACSPRGGSKWRRRPSSAR